MVNIPDPARFALHKLLVSGERPVRERAKATKDVDQAALLIECLLDQSPHMLVDAWKVLDSKGHGWIQRTMKALKRMEHTYPDIHARFTDEVIEADSAPSP